jgi:hypothetical protein
MCNHGDFREDKNFIKPSLVSKFVRERDRLKPLSGRHDDAGVFNYIDAGFTIGLKDGTYAIQWDEIEKITAYKIDLISFDEICLHVDHKDGRFTVSEDTPGWHLFIEKTKLIFPGIDKEWDIKIAYPSFATNLTVIYEKRPVKA